jgi:hypothetical protein
VVWTTVAQESQRVEEQSDSLMRRNGAAILFDRNLSTYNWIGRLFVDTSGSFGTLSARASYAANIIRVDQGSAHSLLQSTQTMLSLQESSPIAEGWKARGRWSSLLYDDEKSAGLNKSAAHTGLIGVGFAPLSFLEFASLGGGRWERQVGVTDRGLSLDLLAIVRNVESEGYRIDGSMLFHRDWIAPRRLGDETMHVTVEKEFVPGTRDSLDAGFWRTRREFYSLADSTIESRLEDAVGIANQLDYSISRELSATLFTGYAGRVLNKDVHSWLTDATPRFGSRIDEFQLDLAGELAYRSDDNHKNARIRLAYSERTESHEATGGTRFSPAEVIQAQELSRQEQTKDNLTRRTFLTATALWPLSASDQLALAGSASILRYDTPSALNVEDRDEQLISGMVGTRHQISPVFATGVTLDGNVSHTVYLLKERSANNNRNYVLRLTPRTQYTPRWWFSTLNMFEVLANYTVYDFERQVVQVKSFSYRQFSWMDSTTVALTHRVGLDFFAYFKLYERGQLKWEEFTERTENATTDKTLDLQLRLEPGPALLCAVGVRFFSQTRYVFEAAGKRLASYLRSVGPTCTIEWRPAPLTRIAFHGWYEQRSPVELTGGATATMTLNILLSL